MSTSMQDVGISIICLKNLENGANSFNLSTNGAPKLISKQSKASAAFLLECQPTVAMLVR
ncbi:hypothetical protein T06_7540 [Trichinella sp. T6]|nr:hypothetical protein T06_7540 [Trichinella sp. T6]